ncbi:hypothetical protein H0H92_008675 [Tricholoma furcatifolium]|nr:hypothetical protein H0H92_008675 [Tricholoma furcatifolium]
MVYVQLAVTKPGVGRLSAVQVARSFVGRYFKLEGSGVAKERVGSRFTTEIRAGLTTWAAMAYIISVNASILSDSGGPCVCTTNDGCATDDVYLACVENVRLDLITTTAAISALASFLMGALANLPVGLAPGLGLNAYWLVRIMPQSLVLAVGAGIGLFIAGLTVVGGDTSDLVGLGGCLPQNYISSDLANYCSGGVLRSPTMWLGIFVGGIFTTMLMLYRIRGAILIGILLVSIISWPRPTSVTYFPYTEAGDALFDYFKKVVTFRPIGMIGNAIDFAGLRDPVTLDFENSTWAYCVDAFCISMGALMGTSPVTSFVESATGISEGGKTGLTAMTVGLAFFVSVFFAPIFSSIPGWATGGALVIVGSLMIRNVKEINWNYIGDAVPAFLTLIIIPLTYNIAYGVIAGIISYMLINGIALLLRKITNDRIIPPNYYEDSEEWVIPPGSIFPGWINLFRKQNSSDADSQFKGEKISGESEENSPKESNVGDEAEKKD